MSDILDALRKAELQRSTPAVPGISTRQRYLTTSGRRFWPAPLVIIGALVLGACLAGAGTVYLIHDNESHSVAQTDAKQADAGKAAPEQKSAARPQATPRRALAAAQGTTAPGSQSAPPSPLQPSAAEEAGQKVLTESAATVAEGGDGDRNGDSENDTPPAPKSPPPQSPPATPPATTETEVALNSATPGGSPQKSAPRIAPNHPERTAYNQIPTATNPLNLIRPPVAVEVQEFQPKLPTPHATRKSAGNSDNRDAGSSGPDVPLLTTLSYQFQTMVPKMSINAQLYSKQPADRFVVINMKRYAEGQQTTDGVTIEAIRQEDIVFSYQGQRFRLNR
ncbi:MAG TPA: general secretion pathway protein GspB [Gammaproteobacteria bacterium]